MRRSPGESSSGAEPSSAADDGDLLVFHAATRRTAGRGYESTAGRVVTIVGRGDDHATARAAAYRGVSEVRLDGSQHRTDIAARELEVGDRPNLDRQAG